MQVVPDLPFGIVYALYSHEYLGYLFDSFIVQMNAKGGYKLQYQNISSLNAPEFGRKLDSIDFQLIDLMEQIQQDAITRKFQRSTIRPADFFTKYYFKRSKYYDEKFIGYIQAFIQRKMDEIFQLLGKKSVFIMGSDGNPTWKKVLVTTHNSDVSFFFERGTGSTHYFPLVHYKSTEIDLQSSDAQILCSNPIWLLSNDVIYSFDSSLDGKKLQPFLSKKRIIIPKNLENEFFKKFAIPLIESQDVQMSGLHVEEIEVTPKPILEFKILVNNPVKSQPTLFDSDSSSDANNQETRPEEELSIRIIYNYGGHHIYFENEKKFSVDLKLRGTDYIFNKIIRQPELEKEIVTSLSNWGLKLYKGRILMKKNDFFSWLNDAHEKLKKNGIEVIQFNTNLQNDGAYFIGVASINMEIQEKADWFDIHAIVQFGDFKIPFKDLRYYIMHQIREFKLPDGRLAVIPDQWFSKYGSLLMHSEGKENVILKKYYVGLVQEVETAYKTKVTAGALLNNLKQTEKLQDMEIDPAFKGSLRAYQQTGFNWLHFLHQLRFGGFLADDMGLGKTIQTLAFIQSLLKIEKRNASLIVMPTSLIYNWEAEAKKFTPNLKLLIYTGQNREKNIDKIDEFDVVITTYGVIRMDVDILKEYPFFYIILDESQAIKNASSQVAVSVKKLTANHRLLLTGTPIENTTLDLWSQMQFANPGLLGSQKFFQNEYVVPIEKLKDSAKLQKLHFLIKPFILRRTKQQVEKELPPKIEQVCYCDMSEEQEKLYEEIKSFYRNQILKSIEDFGVKKSHIILLRGLTQLRQISNHPSMLDKEYTGESGKFTEVTEMLESSLVEGHKILVFSQFVKLLTIFRQYLDKTGLKYAYLDGSTRNRHSEIDRFQKDENLKLFLISLKAGGLGINLTSADYVFILDPWWNPAVENQAIDRAHRIGQKKTVFTYKFITKNTIEEKILNLQRSKSMLANELIKIDENLVRGLDINDIKKLFD